jgi:rhamnogalacturonyl hydrolase YesR
MWGWVRLAAVALIVAGAAHAEPSVRRADAVTLAERVADWQLAHRLDVAQIRRPDAGQADSRGWVQGSFFLALAALAERSHAPRYRDAVLENGRANGWRLGDQVFNADDQLVGASYLWADRHGAGRAALAGVRQRLDVVIGHPAGGGLAWEAGPADAAGPPCVDRWCWADALFMAPPVYFELSRITHDPRYAQFADAEFRAVSDYLFDANEQLYFRDSRFFDRRDAEGRKIFWARGNGWVFAGLARVLQALPPHDPRRSYYETLFQGMAARLQALQRPDGFWSPSLLSDPAGSPGETSGTGFFVYGMAYGVRAGLLPRSQYEPAIRAGWAALQGAVGPDGRVGWVQQVGVGPADVLASDTQLYGAAAVIMAGAAVADLDWR